MRRMVRVVIVSVSPETVANAVEFGRHAAQTEATPKTDPLRPQHVQIDEYRKARLEDEIGRGLVPAVVVQALAEHGRSKFWQDEAPTDPEIPVIER